MIAAPSSAGAPGGAGASRSHRPPSMGTSSALLAGFGCVGLGTAIDLAAHGALATTSGLAQLAYALLHLVALGGLLAGARALARASGLLARPGARRAALLLGALGLATALIPADLEHFAERVAPEVALLVLALGTLLGALALPAAWALGARLRRPRWRALGPLLAVLAALAEPRVLPGLYPGLRVFALALAGVLAASALLGAPLGPRAARLEPPLGLALALLALASVGIPAPLGVRAALAQRGGLLLHELSWPIPRPRVVEIPSRAWWRPARQRASVPPSPVARPVERPIVILLTIDSLRRDLLTRPETRARLPRLAQLAAAGVSFEQAHAPGSMTVATLSSVFKGTLFSQQRWERGPRGGHYFPYHDPQVHFPRLLSEAGVRTFQVPGTDWLVGSYGVVGGFSSEAHRPPRRSEGRNHRWNHADDIVPRLIEELRRLSPRRSAFLYAHVMDPHAPYVLGGQHGSSFDDYLAEVAGVDRELGRLLDFLASSELHRRTYVFVSADHGEAFGEHGRRAHGNGLYEELIHVPLLVVGPGLAPRREEALVSLTDLGPTILDLFGLETPAQFVGQSLWPLLLGERVELTRPVLAESVLMRSYLRPDGVKVIRDLRRSTLEVYDLRRDPEETHNRVDAMSAAMLEAVSELDAFYEVHQLREGGYEPPFRP